MRTLPMCDSGTRQAGELLRNVRLWTADMSAFAAGMGTDADVTACGRQRTVCFSDHNAAKRMLSSGARFGPF